MTSTCGPNSIRTTTRTNSRSLSQDDGPETLGAGRADRLRILLARSFRAVVRMDPKARNLFRRRHGGGQLRPSHHLIRRRLRPARARALQIDITWHSRARADA